jgi:hypothetical protein
MEEMYTEVSTRDNAEAEMVAQRTTRADMCEDIICLFVVSTTCKFKPHIEEISQLRSETRGGDCASAHHGADPRIRYADSTCKLSI